MQVDQLRTAGSFELQVHSTPVSGPDLRLSIPVSEGRTLASLLDRADWRRPLDRTRVYLSGWEVPRERWRWLRPRAGARVVVVGCPADPGTLTAIGVFLSKVATAVAAAVPGSATIGSAVASAAVTAGVVSPLGAGVSAAYVAGTIIGGAAIVAGVHALGASLMDVPSQDLAKGPGQASPTLRGDPNTARPNDPYPYVLGDIRGVPPFGAFPASFVSGTESEALYLFVLGPGPLKIDPADIMLGEVALSSFTDVQVSVREGRSTDGPLTLYTSRIFQAALNNVMQPVSYTDEDGLSEWLQVAVPGTEHQRLGIDLNFTEGLGRISDSGRNQIYHVGFQIQYRKNGGSWIVATTLPSFSKLGTAKPGSPEARKVRGNTMDVVFFQAFERKPFQVGFQWSVTGVEGDQFDVRVRRVETMQASLLRDGPGSSFVFGTVVWYAVKGFNFNDPPITDTGIATIELQVPVNEQFRGLASSLTVRARREARIYDPGAPGGADADGWSLDTFETRNPAALIRDVLQGPGNIRPKPDSRIDVDAFTDFYIWCRDFTTGGSGPLAFDLFVDFAETSIEDLCRTIAAAGLGRFGRDSQGRFTVSFDGPRTTPVAMVNAASARGFRMDVSFPAELHGVRAQYQDRDAGFDANAERIVYIDGFSSANANPGKIEDIRFHGVTDSKLIYVHARRRLAERAQRRRQIVLEQDLEHLAYGVGDLVLLSHPGALVGTHWGRVKASSSARYRDTFEADPAPYAPFLREVSGATLELDARDAAPTHGLGAARIESTGAGVAILAQAFESSAPRDWFSLRIRVDVRPSDADALESADGLRIRLQGPSSAHWAEWHLGTADGITAGDWSTVTVLLGVDAPADSAGAFASGAVTRYELRTNVVDPTAGRVWHFDNLRAEPVVEDVSEVQLDQFVELSPGVPLSIDHRRVDATGPALEIQTRALQGLSEFGVSSDRVVPVLYLSAPLAIGEGPAAGDLVTVGASLRVICHSKEPGPDLTARVTFVDEAPEIQDSAFEIPDFDPVTMLPVPINVLGPGKPTVLSVVTDERALVRARDGSLRAAIRIYLEPSTSRARPATQGWSVRYRRQGGTSYTAAPAFGLSPFVSVADVDELETYDIVIQAVDEQGRSSEPVRLTAFVEGKTNLPPDVQGFRIEGSLLRWSLDDLPADLAGFEIRRGPSGSSFDTARRIHGPMLVAAPPFDLSQVEPGFARLHIKAVDTAGNVSENEATLEAFVGEIPEQNQVDIYDVHAAGFPIVDQIDSVLDGFEGLLPKEMPDGSLEVVPTGDEVGARVISIVSTSGATLDVTMEFVASGARALRVTSAV